MATEVRIDLTPQDGAPALARAILRERPLPDPVLREDAELVVTELVGNAVRHGRLAPGERIRVRCAPSPAGLRIAVSQPAHEGRRPHVVQGDAARGHGNGLRIVDRLAARWGVTELGGRVCVWCELGRAG
jgi:anti-sigma regulatory factor (Ser/Thr protein kinase)